MDLGPYMSVLRRHRRLVTYGCGLAVVLMLLSVFRVSTSGISYRQAEIWSNEATLAVSEASLPELRASLSPTERPERLATLIDVYAAFATSDAVVASLRQKGLLTEDDVKDGKLPIAATAVPSTANAGPTPLLKVSGSGTSKKRATDLTIAATQELIAYVKAGQARAGIAEKDRVELRTVKSSTEPQLVKPRSMSNAFVILLACLTATVAAAFIRENARRRREPAEEETVEPWVSPSPQGSRDHPGTDRSAVIDLEANGAGARPREVEPDPRPVDPARR